MAYADVTELNNHLGFTPNNAQLLLDRASRDVDQALLTAVYDVDANGDPTVQEVIDALRLATLEQIAGNLEAGDKTGLGAPAVPSGFTLGRLSVQRGNGGANKAAQAHKVGRLWSPAWDVLQQAGLTGCEPWTR